MKNLVDYLGTKNITLINRSPEKAEDLATELGLKQAPIENLAEEIAGLKKSRNGGTKDILVFGGANFVSSLIKEGLIDEYHLIINPTAMGNGMTIFNSLERIQKFTPIQSKLYPGGKTVLSYEPKND